MYDINLPLRDCLLVQAFDYYLHRKSLSYQLLFTWEIIVDIGGRLYRCMIKVYRCVIACCFKLRPPADMDTEVTSSQGSPSARPGGNCYFHRKLLVT